MIAMFESFVTLYVFDRDISEDAVNVYSQETDGSIKLADKKCFDALETTMNVAMTA